MLKRTALFEEHQRLGGRLIDFGGWELPVQYTGVMEEHLACRTAADTGAVGVMCLAFPLHPPGRPDKLRSAHLPRIRAPMLFVQGSRDTFGTPQELKPILETLHAPAELCVIEDGDHSFKVRKAAPLSQSAVFDFMLDTVERWLRALS